MAKSQVGGVKPVMRKLQCTKSILGAGDSLSRTVGGLGCEKWSSGFFVFFIFFLLMADVVVTWLWSGWCVREFLAVAFSGQFFMRHFCVVLSCVRYGEADYVLSLHSFLLEA